MEPFTVVRSAVVPLLAPNIDTDQIIPARFVSVRKPSEFAHALFRNRRDEDPEFPLNMAHMQGRAIILAGHNFGCGSSREAAAWALTSAGFRTVISTAFGDIFRMNSLKNGLLPLVVEPEEHSKLVSLVSQNPDDDLLIDLPADRVTTERGRVIVPIRLDPFYRDLLLSGHDELDYLLERLGDIGTFEASGRLPLVTRSRIRSETQGLDREGRA